MDKFLYSNLIRFKVKLWLRTRRNKMRKVIFSGLISLLIFNAGFYTALNTLKADTKSAETNTVTMCTPELCPPVVSLK